MPARVSKPGLTRRDRVRLAILANQLATPGLGSWWMGRRRVGAAQMALALSGFGLVLWWFVETITGAWRAAGSMEGESFHVPNLARLKWGFVLFGLAWLWSGWTSLCMWRAVRRGTPESQASRRADVPLFQDQPPVP
ncbi:MAG: hypothetical protein KatS3mg132_044 [Limisphaera sp.]|nr:MAG: hypothetical protein KatS3mg132_044 [Limisphaera sp.]